MVAEFQGRVGAVLSGLAFRGFLKRKHLVNAGERVILASSEGRGAF